jgi:hypothetical protein
MPLFTVEINRKPIIAMESSGCKSLRKELASQWDAGLHHYLTNWTINGKSVWNGSMKRVVVRLATPEEAANVQRWTLDYKARNPDMEDDDYPSWWILARVDHDSDKRANQLWDLQHPPRNPDGNPMRVN